MSKSDFWMPFYVGDYLADTLHLTTRQHGAYLLLLLAAWKNSGTINGAQARVIARETVEEWQEDESVLAAFFEIDENGWNHLRVLSECVKAAEITQERSKAGSKGAAKRWQSHSRAIENEWQIDGHSQSQSHSPETTNVVSSPRSRKTKLPADWKPTDEELAYAAKQGCSDPSGTAEDFRIHHVGAGTLWGDWHLAFLKWCRNEKNFRRAEPKSNGYAKSDPQALPPSDPWEQRLRGWIAKKQWLPNLWGPPPGHPGCRAPPGLIPKNEHPSTSTGVTDNV